MDKCSICGNEKERFAKKIRGQGKIFRYCDDCYKNWYAKTQAKAFQLVMNKVKNGGKVSLNDTLKIVKEITNENDTTTVPEKIKENKE